MEYIGTFEDIDSIVEWDKNPRDNDHAVHEVANSIKRFGFASPIICREEDRSIIAGHTRFKAAKMLGLSKIPVRFLPLDPVEAQLLALADNKIGELADWNDEMLQNILIDLKEEDLTGLGWTDSELEELMNIEVPEEAESIDSDYDQMPSELNKIAESGGIYEIGNHRVICGDCMEVLKTLPSESVDCIVTDPPYGISLLSDMGVNWDGSVPSDQWAEECFRVLKSGGHIIAFAATKTIHILTTSIEKAGFEIRDQIAWAYFGGFPKSHNVSMKIDEIKGATRTEPVGEAYKVPNAKAVNPHFITQVERRSEEDTTKMYQRMKAVSPEAIQFEGWGTALKPAFEPATFARKPITEKSIALQVLKNGCGAINIEKTRFEYGDDCWIGNSEKPPETEGKIRAGSSGLGVMMSGTVANPLSPLGRWPANVYQCAKPQKAERELGLDELEPEKKENLQMFREGNGSIDGRKQQSVRNIHPTVKPVKLFRFLVNLVCPEGGVVLEPYLGSGTTAVASALEGFQCIGIEREPKYADIALHRIKKAEDAEIIKVENLQIPESFTWQEEQN